MSCFPCQISHSTTGGDGLGTSGPTAYFLCSRAYHPKKSAIGERMHVAQRVYLTPHVFWTVGRLCVSVGDQFFMEF